MLEVACEGYRPPTVVRGVGARGGARGGAGPGDGVRGELLILVCECVPVTPRHGDNSAVDSRQSQCQSYIKWAYPPSGLYKQNTEYTESMADI